MFVHMFSIDVKTRCLGGEAGSSVTRPVKGGMLLTYPLAIAAFYRRLVGAFGGRFVLVVFAIYGLSQGIG